MDNSKDLCKECAKYRWILIPVMAAFALFAIMYWLNHNVVHYIPESNNSSLSMHLYTQSGDLVSEKIVKVDMSREDLNKMLADSLDWQGKVYSDWLMLSALLVTMLGIGLPLYFQSRAESRVEEANKKLDKAHEMIQNMTEDASKKLESELEKHKNALENIVKKDCEDDKDLLKIINETDVTEEENIDKYKEISNRIMNSSRVSFANLVDALLKMAKKDDTGKNWPNLLMLYILFSLKAIMTNDINEKSVNYALGALYLSNFMGFDFKTGDALARNINISIDQIFKYAIENENNGVRSYSYYGFIKKLTGNNSEALTLLKHATESPYALFDCFINLFDIYINEHKMKEARDLFDSFLNKTYKDLPVERKKEALSSFENIACKSKDDDLIDYIKNRCSEEKSQLPKVDINNNFNMEI